jgi:hypothetical protein
MFHRCSGTLVRFLQAYLLTVDLLLVRTLLNVVFRIGWCIRLIRSCIALTRIETRWFLN